jgi:DNA-binding transcriptional LysR family regulator
VDYIQNKGMPARAEEVSRLDGLMASATETVWRLNDAEGAVAEVTPLPRYVANETVSLLEAAKAGLGVACLAASFCAPLVASGALVRLLPDWTAGGVTTTLLMPHRRGQLPSVRVVIDQLIAELSQPPREAYLTYAV